MRTRFSAPQSFFTPTTLRTYLKKLRISYKVAKTNAPGAFTKQAAMKRKDYVNKFWGYEQEGFKFIFIDEAALLTHECKKKGWFTRGKSYQLKLDAIGRRERFTMIAGVSNKGIEGFMIMENGCMKYNFVYFMKKIIERQIEIGENLEKVVFVLDNCSIHRSHIMQQKILSQVYILYLAPYSPFLNAIEWFWSNLKQKLFKKQRPTKKEIMKGAITTSFS